MTQALLARPLAPLALLGLVALVGGCLDPFVGAECAPGYALRGSRCIAVSSDPDAGDASVPDGALLDGDALDGTTLGDGAVLDGEALDAPEYDGALLDGAVLDGAVFDGAVLDGAVLDGAVLDGAVLDGAAFDGAALDAGVLDGSAFDGAVLDAAALDGSCSFDAATADPDLGSLDLGVEPLDGGSVDLGDPDLGTIVCDIGELLCGRACVRPDRDPSNCGDCGVRCGPGDLCVEGLCTPLCEAPLSYCAGLCADLQTDPDHCGTCTTRCPSGLCTDGLCQDAPAGHVVVVGHDYVTRRVGMSRIAGNAVFLGSGNPVRVLAYVGRATAASIAGTDAAIAQVATTRGRSWSRLLALADEVPLRLASAEVFVVYAQAGAGDGELQALGVAWSVALRTFLRRGGVVVVFETPAANLGTWQVLAPAGLFSAASRTVVPSGTLHVMAPGDAVAIDVPLLYSVERNTVRFDGAEGTVVVADALGPVVLHRVVTTP
jgi:hypothetical protein